MDGLGANVNALLLKNWTTEFKYIQINYVFGCLGLISNRLSTSYSLPDSLAQ